MRITIGSAEQDDTGVAVADLYGWLRGETEFRREVEALSLQSRREPGAMGATDVIELVLGQESPRSTLRWRTRPGVRRVLPRPQ